MLNRPLKAGDRVKRYDLGISGQVIHYDRNDGPEWPDGCCGTPFVEVQGDDDKMYSSFAYRWERVEE